MTQTRSHSAEGLYMTVLHVIPEEKGRNIMDAAGLPIATMELAMVAGKL